MGYYDAIAKSYNDLHGEEQKKKLEIISKNINPKQGDKLLDVGCGTGICTKWSCFSVGIDPSFGLVKEAAGKNGNFMQATAEYIPFKYHSFDFVISVTAIHLFEDIDKGLEEMKRVGKDKFVFSILKKSSKANEIVDKIKSKFRVVKEIEEDKDILLFT